VYLWTSPENLHEYVHVFGYDHNIQDRGLVVGELNLPEVDMAADETVSELIDINVVTNYHLGWFYGDLDSNIVKWMSLPILITGRGILLCF